MGIRGGNVVWSQPNQMKKEQTMALKVFNGVWCLAAPECGAPRSLQKIFWKLNKRLKKNDNKFPGDEEMFSRKRAMRTFPTFAFIYFALVVNPHPVVLLSFHSVFSFVGRWFILNCGRPTRTRKRKIDKEHRRFALMWLDRINC